jgi:hypothetical protein
VAVTFGVNVGVMVSVGVKVGVASGVDVSTGVEVTAGVGVSGITVSVGKALGTGVEQADCISMAKITKPTFSTFVTCRRLIFVSLDYIERIQRHPYMNLTNKYCKYNTTNWAKVQL